ncbi:DNA mismatch repair MutS family ATPase domain protein (macronuclear) [Tetrahymena thermophila SB210]|uniref:DNA mismatch repair protein n=2 Tax=Tetrahymena thermophila TaxID=5911 RepID=Q23AD6_TETTS|nr:DNA mismatch repair MutS family ATPase domain protein [Tetrahymena thermophila SB210]ABK35676.1 putative mismatch repair protein [Tetrahymena thermophila]EAR93556.2 DNA mismatch repair MutS family ATPase domain protein [Tetrahymena thermophila SB210]|eukprot:XP_001013801.2 DNA mismatch repair MutS family ATPase domain protein [Tetrahymena thermophila SB210]
MQINLKAKEFSTLDEDSSSDDDQEFVKRILGQTSKNENKSDINTNPIQSNAQIGQKQQSNLKQNVANSYENQFKGLNGLYQNNSPQQKLQPQAKTSSNNLSGINKSLLNKSKKSTLNQSDDEAEQMNIEEDQNSVQTNQNDFLNQFQMQSKQTTFKNSTSRQSKQYSGDNQKGSLSIPNKEEEQLNQIPKFAQQRYRKDSRQIPFGNPQYDPTTLYIPPQEFSKLTSAMKQYWQIKAKHFDKIILFKMGKFYELFYEDAIIATRLLDITFTNKELHCGFPEKALEKFASKLVQFGYKVVVVEQTSKKTTTGIVDRDITQIITKGTINFTFEEQNHDPKYLLVIRQKTNQEFGIIVYESFTSKIQVGLLQDDKTQTRLKSFLCVTKPQEIVYDPGNITSDILKILKSQYFQSVMSPMRDNKDQWSTQLATFYIEKQFGSEVQKYPQELRDIRTNDEIRGQVINLKYAALAGFFSYMDSTLQLESILNSSEYVECDFDNKQFSQRMILDSQALQHLEIFENSQTALTTTFQQVDQKKGTLLNYLDYTKTPYGKRMLKKWVCSPLIDISAINDRYDAIEDIQNNLAMKDKFQYGIARYADIERLCSSIYRYSVKQKHAEKAVMYENISSARLKEFKNLINSMKEIEKLIEETFMVNQENFKSQRLKRLCTYRLKGDPKLSGDLPKVSSFIKVLEDIIVLDSKEKIAGKYIEQPVPKDGFCQEYDSIRLQIKAYQDELDQYLEQLKVKFKTNDISYAFLNNRQYDIQVNKTLFDKIQKPADFSLQSHSGSFQRFTSRFTSEKVAFIEELEEQLKEILSNFCVTVFREFYKKKHVWDKFVSIVAELDCLISISHACFTMADGVMCRPVIKFAKNQKETFFYLKQGRNPNLIQLDLKQVPNDIILGNIAGMNAQPNIMILTGPNMGGKSTTLRLFCLSAILAQIGCYVPAEQCEFSLVDRIFTRIGAGDKLIEGKSTFYIEMEEVKNSIMYGTYNSIAIFDELGRGTSTFDGVAIAFGILKYFIEKIQSRCIFATHFFLLINELRFYKEISFYHMEYYYDNKSKKLIFKYKLKQGNAESSFGIDLAKIVGIEQSVLNLAQKKQLEFENSLEYAEVEKQQTIKQFNGLISKLFTYEKDRIQ